ncbi:MAG TPA: bifunctional phosphopantothenoylcysteine decarboxylase/phosphopantothenate--cysteine ligase CoaBC [Thermoanaerobaculia bacterium]|nr:bifunctional phosphopantothenoylcysteine decarboxylase/phosphopantothenate--cysteine ligase CoaBC [Thermoanaerobaculia bacterium]
MNIVLGISGGIAAYKTPDLVRRLRDARADVRVIMTANATRFVSPLSLSAVSNHGVLTDQWGDPSQGGVDHIEIARWADLLLVAPATANLIAKLAVGIADDALTTYALAHRAPIVVVPAMNTTMFGHPTVRQNLETLRIRGVEILDPDSGILACGDEGVGRMPDPPAIVEHVMAQSAPRDLEGKRVVVTAGPTREPIDPVRYLSNRSSGKMGYALAAAARRRGAEVTLVSGPTRLAPPHGVRVVPVMTAAEMRDAVIATLPACDLLIKAAAVADFTVSAPSTQKIKKSPGSGGMTLELARTPDILEAVRGNGHGAYVIAFAAETENVEANAREKLDRKQVDLVVANDVSDVSIGFDSDQNAVTLFDRNGESLPIPRAPKLTIANRILDRAVAAMGKSAES